jgi:Ca2+-binding EF-hand superfamily protein
MKFEDYCDNLDKMMALTEEEKFRICFEILDFDNDKKLSVNDVLSFMQFVKETDILNMNDLQKILKHTSMCSSKFYFHK